MIQLNKIKDRIMEFVGRYEIYVMAGVRFAIGFAAFRLIIMNLGYSDVLAGFPFALILALACCFLPAGVMLFAAAVLILVELYALSTMLCLIVGLIFLIMFCAYMRFANRKGLYAVLTPIMSILGVPYTMPVVCGLRGEPYAVISVICGEATYFMLQHITFNAPLYVVSDDSEAASILTMATSELLLDREMYLYLIGFAAAAIVTYCISRLRFNRSHLVAAAVGIGSQLAIICIGEYYFLGNRSALVRILVGCIVSFLILLIVSFFTHNLDYKRVENVQFEDDDYYYFVRAIPKSFLPPKKWNPQANAPKKKPEAGGSGNPEPERTADAKRSAAQRPPKSRYRRDAVEITDLNAQDETEQAQPAAETVQTQLAADAAQQAAAAEEAERAAAEAAAERAEAAARAISRAAGHAEEVPEEVPEEITEEITEKITEEEI